MKRMKKEGRKWVKRRKPERREREDEKTNRVDEGAIRERRLHEERRRRLQKL